MSLFSSIGNSVGLLFGIGDDKDSADAAKARLQAAIKSGALQASAQFGQAGQALHDKAGNLIDDANVGLDYGKVDADQARLDAVKQHYLNQYANGGLAGQAAVQAQQAQRGLSAQGGVGGIRQDTLASADTQSQVGQIAQNEINQAGEATNNLDAQKAAMALRRAVLAGQVSNANFMKNINTQQADFNLYNSQQNLNNEAQSATNMLDYNERNLSLDYDNTQYEVGKQLTEFLMSAIQTGASAAAGMPGAEGASQPAGTGIMAAQPAEIVPSSSGIGAGYIAPSVTMGRAAKVNEPNIPIFSTPPTLPTTANFFSRGGA